MLLPLLKVRKITAYLGDLGESPNKLDKNLSEGLRGPWAKVWGPLFEHRAAYKNR